MYIEIKKGFKIRYDEYRKDKQKLVLFIHGLGSSPIVWRDIPQALSEYFRDILHLLKKQLLSTNGYLHS
jgi:pimeloyl-ACP methyl ester carboxylesterase